MVIVEDTHVVNNMYRVRTSLLFFSLKKVRKRTAFAVCYESISNKWDICIAF